MKGTWPSSTADPIGKPIEVQQASSGLFSRPAMSAERLPLNSRTGGAHRGVRALQERWRTGEEPRRNQAVAARTHFRPAGVFQSWSLCVSGRAESVILSGEASQRIGAQRDRILVHRLIIKR